MIGLVITAGTLTEMQDAIDAKVDVGAISIFVASSTATAAEKAMATATYTCDGTADDVQIQAAIDALTSGGKIQLSSGPFYIATRIAMDQTDIELVGSGWSTILQPSADVDVIAITVDRCSVKDLYINGDASSRSSGHGITVAAADRTYLDHLRIETTKEEAIQVSGGSYWGLIERCVIRNTYDDGILIDSSNEWNILACLVGAISFDYRNDKDAVVLSNASNCKVGDSWFDLSRYGIGIMLATITES